MALQKNTTHSVCESAYTIAKSEDMQSAELTMYGEVVRTRPDKWNGTPADGSYIIENEILAGLKALNGIKELTIRINSCGGECNTAIAIHNKLREMAADGTAIKCIVDGVAMSVGSYIMCAADSVAVSEGSIIMIHKAMSFVYGYYNADQLRQTALGNDAYDKALLAAYKRRTGKTDEELLRMMSAETYMTGAEAIENGFADELTESSDQVSIAAAADKSGIIVNGRLLRLCGEKCPEGIPTQENVITALSAGGKSADEHKTNEKGGKKHMAKNLAELKAENPELAACIEQEIRANLAEESKDMVAQELAAERTRLEKIDAIAGQVSAELLADAKYKHPCTAEELAYREMSENAKKGEAFLADMARDYSNSGMDAVKAAPESIDSKADEKREACAFIRQALGKENA